MSFLLKELGIVKCFSIGYVNHSTFIVGKMVERSGDASMMLYILIDDGFLFYRRIFDVQKNISLALCWYFDRICLGRDITEHCLWTRKKRILTPPAIPGAITRRSRRRPKSTIPLCSLKFRLKPFLQQKLEKKKDPNGSGRSGTDHATVLEAPEIDRTVVILEISFATVFSTKPWKKKDPNGTGRSGCDHATVPEAPEINHTVVILAISCETFFWTKTWKKKGS